MACNDACGLWTPNACAWAGIKVPDEAAVVGVSNDDCLCTLAHPPLSSIDLAPRSIGYEAAAWLDRLMSAEQSPAPQILVPPRGVVTRPSTDVTATDNPAVSQAVAFIRDHACHNIRVAAVLRHVSLSRSALEPRLKRAIGRTIHDEVQRVQIERVKGLLTSTDLPIEQVAQKTGLLPALSDAGVSCCHGPDASPVPQTRQTLSSPSLTFGPPTALVARPCQEVSCE